MGSEITSNALKTSLMPCLPGRRHTVPPNLHSSGSLVGGISAFSSMQRQPGTKLPEGENVTITNLGSMLAYCLLMSETNKANENGISRSLMRQGSIVLDTVSVADDGTAGVGPSAAAAVSVALAHAWASSGTNRGSSNGRLSPYGGKARFKLIAAVPRNSLSAERAGSSEGDLTRSLESTMALESLDDTDALSSQEQENWRASGSHLKLHWLEKPKTVLVCCKPTSLCWQTAGHAVLWLLLKHIVIYSEPQQLEQIISAVNAAKNDLLQGNPLPEGVFSALSVDPPKEPMEALQFINPADQIHTWHSQCRHTIPHDLAEAIDMVLTLGGDGTVLWACSLFASDPVPPVVPIAMGSLGFMTPFLVSKMGAVLSGVTSTQSGFPLMLRHRLECHIERGIKEEHAPLDAQEEAGCPQQTIVLNELVIDRGSGASLCNLHVHIDKNFVTAIQGDGLIVATPTGSTAYNLAAGGSMIHPGVPCVLFTPICPHTLSSRPLVFPEHVNIKVKVPLDSRNEAYCSFDGKSRQVLEPGDSIHIRMSRWPAPMVCSLDASHDWFLSVREGLNWNIRVQQKGLRRA